MLEIKCHADVEKLKDHVVGTYAWDFCLCIGDTIREKYESLLEILRTFSVRRNESTVVPLMVASPEITSIIEVMLPIDSFNFAPSESDTDIQYVGDFEKSCGSNGFKTGFGIIKDRALDCSEFYMVCGDEVKLIKVFNFVI